MDLNIYENKDVEKISKKFDKRLLSSYNSIDFSEKNANIIRNINSNSLFYVSLHKSHLDYIIILNEILKKKLPFPHTISGENLLKGIINKSFQFMLGIDPEEVGAISISRGNKANKEIVLKRDFIKNLLIDNKSILEFPEGGRSYQGDIKDFKNALFDGAIKASEVKNDVYFVPITVSYDFMAEGPYINKMNFIQNLKNIKIENWNLFSELNKLEIIQKNNIISRASKLGNIPLSLFGKAFYSIHETVFFTKALSLGSGNVYLDVGTPLKVNPKDNRKDLSQILKEELGRIYRINPTALTAKSIEDCYTNPKGAHKINYNTTLNKFYENYNILIEKKCNIYKISDISECVEKTIEDFMKKGIIKKNGFVEKSKIKYYSNTIRHVF